MYVQSGCKSAIMLSILLAPKLTPNFQGLYVGKEYRGWSGGGGVVGKGAPLCLLHSLGPSI